MQNARGYLKLAKFNLKSFNLQTQRGNLCPYYVTAACDGPELWRYLIHERNMEACSARVKRA